MFVSIFISNICIFFPATPLLESVCTGYRYGTFVYSTKSDIYIPVVVFSSKNMLGQYLSESIRRNIRNIKFCVHVSAFSSVNGQWRSAGISQTGN